MWGVAPGRYGRCSVSKCRQLRLRAMLGRQAECLLDLVHIKALLSRGSKDSETCWGDGQHVAEEGSARVSADSSLDGGHGGVMRG